MATQAVRSRRGQSCAAAGGVGGKSSSPSRRWSQARAASVQTSLSLLLDRRASSDIRRTRSAGMRTCAGSTGIETRIDSATTGSYVAEVQRHVGPALADDMPGAAAADDGETERTGSETGQAPEASALATGSSGMGASQVIGGTPCGVWSVVIRTFVLLLYPTKDVLSSQAGPANFAEHGRRMAPGPARPSQAQPGPAKPSQAQYSGEAPRYVSSAVRLVHDDRRAQRDPAVDPGHLRLREVDAAV
jgi:hypothetical protein